MSTRDILNRLANDDLSSGLYHVPATALGADVVDHLDKQAVRVVTVDLSEVGDKRELLAALAKALEFPEWFGGNLDALADSLSEVARPIVLELRGARGIATEHRKAWHAVCDVLAETAPQYDDEGRFVVIVCDAPNPKIAPSTSH
jgi:RNAse (barnase) inhibitor barstar